MLTPIGCCFGGNHDTGLIAEIFNQCGADIDIPGTGNASCALVGIEPVFINGSGFRAVVGAAELNNLARIAIGFKIIFKINLCAARFFKKSVPYAVHRLRPFAQSRFLMRLTGCAF